MVNSTTTAGQGPASRRVHPAETGPAARRTGRRSIAGHRPPWRDGAGPAKSLFPLHLTVRQTVRHLGDCSTVIDKPPLIR